MTRLSTYLLSGERPQPFIMASSLSNAPDNEASIDTSRDECYQDKNIYKDLIQGLKRQIAHQERAAAARRGESPQLEQTRAIEEQDEVKRPVTQNSMTATDVIKLHRLAGVAEVISTRELLEKIISTLDVENIFSIRFVNKFWKDTVRGLSRLQNFRRRIRQVLCFESIDIGPVERGTAMSRQYANPQCTATSIWHTDCCACYNIKKREQAIFHANQLAATQSPFPPGPPKPNLQRSHRTRPIVLGEQVNRNYKVRHWLGFEQFTINPC